MIPDLQDRITYIAFLNDILSSKFKFSLAESKVTNLADTLRKAQDFIGAIKICAGDASNQHENRKRLGGDWDAQLDKHPKWNEERCGHFTLALVILMEIKGSAMLRRPKPIENSGQV